MQNNEKQALINRIIDLKLKGGTYPNKLKIQRLQQRFGRFKPRIEFASGKETDEHSKI
mgnify:CR=1 FL=1